MRHTPRRRAGGTLARLAPLLMLLVALVAGCAPGPNGQRPAQTPTATTQPTAPPVPAGLAVILPGLRFTDSSGTQGLVASAARPGRVAGCGLAAASRASVPTFALSDDGGQTWSTSTIPGAPVALSCSILADSQQPDTFVAWWLGDVGMEYSVTTDAGHTWRSLPAAAGATPGMGSRANLVAGHLFGLITPPGSQNVHLAELSLAGGGWRILDERLSIPSYSTPQLVFAVAPEDPATVYVVTDEGSTLVLTGTHDSGATWRTVLSVPGANRVALWTARARRVYLEQTMGTDTAAQFFASADGGTTWNPIGLHTRTGGETMFIGPEGHIITLTERDATWYTLFTLDPATGVFARLGTYAFGPNAAAGTLVEGPHPALLYAKTDVTYRYAIHAAW